MATYTKSDDFVGGIFTLQNGVKKIMASMGEIGPHWVPNGAPLGPHGVPNIRTMGEFSPMGAPMTNDGGKQYANGRNQWSSW